MEKLFWILDNNYNKVQANYREVEHWLEAQKHLVLQEQVGPNVVSTIFDINGEFETVILTGELNDDKIGVKNQGEIHKVEFSDTYEKAMFAHRYFKFTLES